jgi:hypothetical protein
MVVDVIETPVICSVVPACGPLSDGKFELVVFIVRVAVAEL